MTISPTKFERTLHDRLLDIVFDQWRALGVPFSVPRTTSSNEIIDLEALLWCSLEYFPTQPRLCESVVTWLRHYPDSLLLPRLRRFARLGLDPRTPIAHLLDPAIKPPTQTPLPSTYGLRNPEAHTHFLLHFRSVIADSENQGKPIGTIGPGNASALLRARDALGYDGRHFILIYLLAHHSRARLRSIAEWCGHSYRNIAQIAQRWQNAGWLTIDHGLATLKHPELWCTLLKLDHATLVLPNWHRCFEICIQLLRSLQHARNQSLEPDSPVIAALLGDAHQKLQDALPTDPLAHSPTTHELISLLAEHKQVAATCG